MRNFDEIKRLADDFQRKSGGIGTQTEGSLHHFLKFYFEQNSDFHEVGINGYFADICNDDGIIEIQTRGFSAMKPKLNSFLPQHHVTVVHPLAKTKYLSWLNTETGERGKPRKSPRQANIYDCVRELYSLRSFFTNPNFHFCVIFMKLEEIRLLNGWSRDKKKGSRRYDRLPEGVDELVYFNDPADYERFIPTGLKKEFSIKDFAECAKIKYMTANMTLRMLEIFGLAERERVGRSYTYRLK